MDKHNTDNANIYESQWIPFEEVLQCYYAGKIRDEKPLF